MKFVLHILLLVLCLNVQAQISSFPNTYKDMCFYTLDKKGFDEYLMLYELVKRESPQKAAPELKTMLAELKTFDVLTAKRDYRQWYETFFTDFETYAQNAQNGMYKLMEMYKKLLSERKNKYYHDNMFLHFCLARKADYFFKDFWFTGPERYFSNSFVQKFSEMNPEGDKLFKISEFYYSFERFNRLLVDYEDELHRHLHIGQYGEDVWGYLDHDLINYSYWYVNPTTAAYILRNFKMNEQTGNPFQDYEMATLRKYLELARDGKIWLVGRFFVPEQRSVIIQDKE